MAGQKKHRLSDVRFVAMDPAGVSVHLSGAIGQRLSDIIGEQYRNATVKMVRFLPSTKSSLSGGNFEVLANAMVELGSSTRKIPARLEQLETVVRIADGQREQRLAEVTIPQFVAARAQRDSVEFQGPPTS